jgi:hypothetical protein
VVGEIPPNEENNSCNYIEYTEINRRKFLNSFYTVRIFRQSSELKKIQGI